MLPYLLNKLHIFLFKTCYKCGKPCPTVVIETEFQEKFACGECADGVRAVETAQLLGLEGAEEE